MDTVVEVKEPVKASELNKKPEQMFVINVNGKELPIFKFFVEKGKSVNEPFFAPKIEDIKLGNIGDYLPAEAVEDNLLRPSLKRFCMGVFNEAKSRALSRSNGGEDVQTFEQTLEAEFTGMFLKVSSASESLRALKSQRDDLLAELPSVDAVKNPEKFQALVLKIQDICKTIEEKTAPDEEPEESVAKAA